MLGAELEKITEIETRNVVMGHLQRGGSPTAHDRVLATNLGTKAVDMVVKKRFGYMVGVKGNSFAEVSLANVAKGPRVIPLNHLLIKSARSVGTCFGN